MTEGEHSGGSVDYYKVHIAAPTTEGVAPYTAECNDIIEALGMNYAEGNVLKALWRSCAERTLGKKKRGGNAVYDAEKIVFFGDRVLVQRSAQQPKMPTPLSLDEAMRMLAPKHIHHPADASGTVRSTTTS